MRCICTSMIAVLAMAASAVAETHVIVVDATSITPDTLEVAPGDIVVFDSTCATIVATGQSCIHDGILTGANSPPNCGGFQWEIPQLATAELSIFARAFSGECDENRTAVITVVNGATLHVPSQYTSIADAIAAAESGDRILIEAGTYIEHDLYIDKTITLQGETNSDGTSGVVIDAQEQGRVFELVGGGPAPGELGLIILDNLVMTGGAVDGDGGGVLINNCSPIFRNCTITQNSCSGNGGGVHAARAAVGAPWIAAQPKFAFCTISDNEAQDGGGMYGSGDAFADGCQLEIAACIITDNTASGGIGGLHHVGGGGTSVDDSIVCGNYPGQYFGVVNVDNNSCTLSQCLDDDEDGVVDGCEGGDDDGILDVPGEYPTIPMAIVEASDGDTINIAAGNYSIGELEIEDLSLLLLGATNSDGTPAVTISGTLEIFYTETGEITIEDLNINRLGIFGGAASVRNCNVINSSGQWAGLILSNVLGTIVDSTISNHHGTFFGGGFTILDYPETVHPRSEVTLINCAVEDNTGSGLFGSGGQSGISIGAMDSQKGVALDLIGCIVRNNNASIGGIRMDSFSELSLFKTTVCGNSSDGQIIGTWTDNGGNTVQDECPVDCPGDIDGDQDVDIDDFSEFLVQFGQIGPGLSADIDGDQDVDIDDFSDFLVNFGNDCNAPLRAAPVKSKVRS